ncbi:hypothetical protein CSUI_011495, partial [Cystoisospora suis]
MSGHLNVLASGERVSSAVVPCGACLDIEFPTLTTTATVGSGGLSAGSAHCVLNAVEKAKAAPVSSGYRDGFRDADGRSGIGDAQGQGKKSGRGMAFSPGTEIDDEGSKKSCLDSPEGGRVGTSLRALRTFSAAAAGAAYADLRGTSVDRQFGRQNRHSSLDSVPERSPRSSKSVRPTKQRVCRQPSLSVAGRRSFRPIAPCGHMALDASRGQGSDVAVEHRSQRKTHGFSFPDTGSAAACSPRATGAWSSATGSRLRYHVEGAGICTPQSVCGPPSPHLHEEKLGVSGETKEMEKLASLVAERDLFKAAFGAAKEELDELEAGNRRLREALKENNRRLLRSQLVLQEQARHLRSLEVREETRRHFRVLDRGNPSKQDCTKREEEQSGVQAVRGRVRDSKPLRPERNVKEHGPTQAFRDCPEGVLLPPLQGEKNVWSSSCHGWDKRFINLHASSFVGSRPRSRLANSQRPCRTRIAGLRACERNGESVGFVEVLQREAGRDGEQVCTLLSSFPLVSEGASDILRTRICEGGCAMRNAPQPRCSVGRQDPPRYLLSPSAACSHVPSERCLPGPSNWLLQDAALLPKRDGKPLLLDAHKTEVAVSSGLPWGHKLHHPGEGERAADGNVLDVDLGQQWKVWPGALRPGIKLQEGSRCRSSSDSSLQIKDFVRGASKRRNKSEPSFFCVGARVSGGRSMRVEAWCARKVDGTAASRRFGGAMSREVRAEGRNGSAIAMSHSRKQSNGRAPFLDSECLITPSWSADFGGNTINGSVAGSLDTSRVGGVPPRASPSSCGPAEVKNPVSWCPSSSTSLEKTKPHVPQPAEEGAEDKRVEVYPARPRSIVDSYIWLQKLASEVRKGVYPSLEVLLRGIEEQEQLLRVAQTMEEEREQYIDAVANLHAELRSVRDEACIYLLAHQQQAADLQQEADEVHAVADLWFQAYLRQMRNWQHTGYGSLLHLPPPAGSYVFGGPGPASAPLYGSNVPQVTLQTGTRGVAVGGTEGSGVLYGRADVSLLAGSGTTTSLSPRSSPQPASLLRAAEVTLEMQVLAVGSREEAAPSVSEDNPEDFCWQVVPNDDDVVRRPVFPVERKGK